MDDSIHILIVGIANRTQELAPAKCLNKPNGLGKEYIVPYEKGPRQVNWSSESGRDREHRTSQPAKAPTREGGGASFRQRSIEELGASGADE